MDCQSRFLLWSTYSFFAYEWLFVLMWLLVLVNGCLELKHGRSKSVFGNFIEEYASYNDGTINESVLVHVIRVII